MKPEFIAHISYLNQYGEIGRLRFYGWMQFPRSGLVSGGAKLNIQMCNLRLVPRTQQLVLNGEFTSIRFKILFVPPNCTKQNNKAQRDDVCERLSAEAGAGEESVLLQRHELRPAE